jgi:nitroreductase
MDFEKLVALNRTYRRFESYRIEYNILEKLVSLARLSASGANKQPLKFLLFNTPADCSRIFPFTAWAGYLKEWPGPDQGERPSAYIVILGDTSVSESFGVDHGIAAQSIMLGASSRGLGGCMIGSIRRDGLMAELGIPRQYEVLLILAIGKPVEKVVVDEVINGDVKYWRDEEKTHHVPKRPLSELILKFQ